MSNPRPDRARASQNRPITVRVPRAPALPIALERVAAFAACLTVSWLLTRNLLRPDVFSADAFVHQYWMWQWRDPALFTDSLTATLRESARYPDGYQALFWLATKVTSPIVFGEWLGVGLMAVSAWLVFLIVREHTDWRPAAWIAAAIFLSLVDIHRFFGGFPRGFVHPVVLLVVLLAIRRRNLPRGADRGRGGVRLPDGRAAGERRAGRLGAARAQAVGSTCARAAYAALALAGGRPRSRSARGGAPAVLSASEARGYDEFGADGALNFFVPSVIDYLRQNRSGFDLQASGSALLLAALLLLFVARGRAAPAARGAGAAGRGAARLGGGAARPLPALPAASLHVSARRVLRDRGRRAAAAGVGGRAAALAAGRARADLRLRRVLVPARPDAAAGGTPAGAGRRRSGPRRRARGAAGAPATGAAVLGVAILVAVAGATENWKRGSPCPRYAATGFLSPAPDDTVIAGDPMDLKCLPATTRRAVVASTQLAPSYETEYFLQGRERMFTTLRAVYGPSPQALGELQDRFGATHLWIRRDAIRKVMRSGGARWRRGNEPYGRFIPRAGEQGRAGLAAPARRPAAAGAAA